MANFLNYDGPLFSALNKITDLIWLNILWILCCLPIFTIGASTTALFYVTLHMVKNEGGGVTKTFFREFKRNFKQGTGIWLIFLVVGVILCSDLYIIVWMFDLPNLIHTVFVCINFVLLLYFILTLLYVFPLQATFENKVKHTIKNAMILSIGHLPQSIVIGFCYFALFFLLYLMPEIMTPIVTFIGFSGISFGVSRMFLGIFKKHMKPEDAAKKNRDPDAWEIPEDDSEEGTAARTALEEANSEEKDRYAMEDGSESPEKGTEFL